MSTSSLEFSESKFLEQLTGGSDAVGAPYSEASIKAVLEVYGKYFQENAVQVRATSKYGDPFAYRLLTHKPIGALDIAIKAGFIKEDDDLLQLTKGWLSLFSADGAYEQADFQADIGFTRVFLYLGAVQHLDKVIDAPFVPESIKKNKAAFMELGLEPVQVIEPDFVNRTVAFYFIASGPLTREQANKLAALAGAPPPTDFTYDEMSILLQDGDFFFVATMDLDTGRILRVYFYILFPIELPGGRLPEVGPLLTTFWDVPSYDEEEMDILCWAFGADIEPFMQAERGYTGDLRNILRDWKIMTVE